MSFRLFRLLARPARLVLLLGLACAPVAPRMASASTVMVVGDVNAVPTANVPLYTNFLDTASSVLFSRSSAVVARLWTEFQSLPGLSVAQSAAPLTATSLATVDLLILSTTFDTMMSYSDLEMAAAKDFVLGGGNVLMVAEAQNAAAIDSYNSVLTRLGTAIRYTGLRFLTSEKIELADATGLLSGLTRFSVAKYNTLSGGSALIEAANGPVVMTEGFGVPAPVPLPAGLAQFAAALTMLGLAGAGRKGTPRTHRRRRSGRVAGAISVCAEGTAA